MPAIEPITGVTHPTQSDGPLGGLQIGNVVKTIAPNTYPTYANESDRNAAFSAWVAAGGAMRNGLHSHVVGIGDMVYRSGGWTLTESWIVPNMAGRPSSPTPAQGRRIFDNTTKRSYEFDGTYWRNPRAAGAEVPAGATAGDYLTGLSGTHVGDVAASGRLNIPIGHTFSAVSHIAQVGPGDSVNDLAYVTINSSLHGTSFIAVTCYRPGGTVVPAGLQIRVNWQTVGYND